MSTTTRPDDRNPLNHAAPPAPPQRGGFRLRHLLYVTLYFALIFWLGVLTGLILISGFLGLLFAVVCAGVYVFAGRRSTQQDAMLWALAVTAERAMPMAPTFDAIAGQCRGEYRRKVLAAAHYVRQGLSLPEVIAREPGLFPRDAEVLNRAGHECGTLGAALREAAALRGRSREPWLGLAVRLSYLLWVLVVFQGVAGFMSWFIVPKFEAIFNDFGVPLPNVTILYIDISHYFYRYAYLVFPLFLFQLGLLGLAAISTLGVMPWDLPFVGHLFFRRHAAAGAQVPGPRRGRQSTEGAVNPVAGADRSGLGGTAPPAQGRARYRSRCRLAERALHARGLISARPRRRSWRPQSGSGTLSWALRQVADGIERRMLYRLQLCAQWMVPLLVLAVGALVFMMAVAYFTPLLVLIEKLAG